MYIEQELFSEEEFFQKDESELEPMRILMSPLYFSEAELKEYKKLLKEGMRRKFPTAELNTNDKANASDFILNLLRELYGS